MTSQDGLALRDLQIECKDAVTYYTTVRVGSYAKTPASGIRRFSSFVTVYEAHFWTKLKKADFLDGSAEEKKALRLEIQQYFVENLSETIDNMKKAGCWSSLWAAVMTADTVFWLMDAENELKKFGDDAAHELPLAVVRTSAENYMASLPLNSVVKSRVFALLQVHESARNISKNRRK